MGQTVNLLSFDFGGSNPSAPTQIEEAIVFLSSLFCPCLSVGGMPFLWLQVCRFVKRILIIRYPVA
jgi:hypothetical protein